MSSTASPLQPLSESLTTIAHDADARALRAHLEGRGLPIVGGDTESAELILRALGETPDATRVAADLAPTLARVIAECMAELETGGLTPILQLLLHQALRLAAALPANAELADSLRALAASLEEAAPEFWHQAPLAPLLARALVYQQTDAQTEPLWFRLLETSGEGSWTPERRSVLLSAWRGLLHVPPDDETARAGRLIDMNRIELGLLSLNAGVRPREGGPSLVRHALRVLAETFPRSPQFWENRLGHRLDNWPAVLREEAVRQWPSLESKAPTTPVVRTASVSGREPTAGFAAPRRRPFRGLRRAPDSRYDAVIIGAGIGGLFVANLLARAGLKTLLVEQHYMVGGYCATFRRSGFTFDAATHFYPLLGNPESFTGRLLSELGVRTGWIKMDPVDIFHLPDGSRFAVPADFSTYLARLKAEFPEESSALDEFFGVVRETYLLGLLHYFRGKPLSQVERLAPYLGLSVHAALDRFFRDRKLKLLLTADCPHWGSPPERTSFVFDSIHRLSYFLGNYYPQGGSQAFSDDLAGCFEEQGGHVLVSTLVRKIVVDHGTACGVELEVLRGNNPPHGSRHIVKADVVVSNSDLIHTLERLVGAEHLPPRTIEAIRSLRVTYPCFNFHLGLNDVPDETLNNIQGYYWEDWDMDKVGSGALRCKIFVPTLYEPAIAPPGKKIIVVQKVLDMDYEAVEDWPEHKRQVERLALDHLEHLDPGITRKIVVSTSASARTARRFTLNQKGAMLGWEMSPEQLGEGRPDITTPIKNLYLVGHWTRPGGGITPVIFSAQRVASAVIQEAKGVETPAGESIPGPLAELEDEESFLEQWQAAS